MPQRSVPYAAGRVWVMETRLLDKNRFARLTEASAPEALRMLGEMGYEGVEGYLWYVKLGKIEKVEL